MERGGWVGGTEVFYFLLKIHTNNTDFPSGGYVDDVNSQTNYQLTSVVVIHLMNGAGVCVLDYMKN